MHMYTFQLQHACLKAVNCKVSYIKVTISTLNNVTDIILFCTVVAERLSSRQLILQRGHEMSARVCIYIYIYIYITYINS